MSRFIRAGLVVAFLSVVWSPFGAAQDTSSGPIQERIRRNIYTLRLLQMTQALELSEEQTSKIFPVLNRQEKGKADVQRQLAEAIRDLRVAIRGREAGAEELLAAAERVKAFRRSIFKIDAEVESFLEEQLTPVQRAKYVLFSIDFYQGLGERLRKARGPIR